MWHELQLELEARERVNQKRALRAVPDALFDIASNDYLGLSRHPEVIRAAQEAAQKFGTGARASRLVSGNFSLVDELERELAKWKSSESALVFSSGFAANIGTLSALSNAQTTLFCHKRNHASLLDGCRLAQSKGAQTRFFESGEKLESLLSKTTATRKIVVADGVFSMDGDVLPLPEILALCEAFDATLVLDDAHGTGTLGATGRGIEEHFGAMKLDWKRSSEPLKPGHRGSDDLFQSTSSDAQIITIGTLSKSLGSQGGFVCGPRVAIDFLLGSAPSFVYSTGLNPPAVGAALAALRVIEREPARVARCRQNARFLADEIQKLGFDARFAGSPIVPVILGEERDALALSAQLEARGVWCPAIRPPTVARGTSRLRIAVSSEWTRDELDCVVAAFKEPRA